MRILVAPQGFKGTLSGPRAASAIAEGVARVLPDAEVDRLPVADGGHGTLDVLLAATGGQARSTAVTGPMGHTAEARWGVLGDGATAVIEMAEASGLTLVPESERDPMRATTYGTGQLLATALDEGFRRIIVGVGGSATVDGGAGALQALGVRLTDSQGNDVPFGAAGLAGLAHVSTERIHPALASAAIEVATDVTNPLCGPHGAAMVYGPQKGALPHQLSTLDGALANLAAVVARDTGVEVRELTGAGAAGGLAAGLAAIGAHIVPGAGLICDAIGIDAHIQHAALVVTGEGRLDEQTLFNKAPMEVAKRAAAMGVACIAIGGSIGPGAEALSTLGIALQEATADDGAPVPGEAEAYERLIAAAERIVRRATGAGLVGATS